MREKIKRKLWILIPIVFFVLLICLLSLPFNRRVSSYIDKAILISLFTFGVYYLTLGVIAAAAYYAKKNLDTLNDQLDTAKKNVELLNNDLKIKYQSQVLEQICCGILNPSGKKENEDIDTNYYVVFYRRIKNNGFYEGVRAFLGEMMNAPFSDKLFTDAKDNALFGMFVTGASRFGFSWDELFRKFHDICKMMKAQSGLEEYFVDKKYPHRLHTLNEISEMKEGMEQLELVHSTELRITTIGDGNVAPFTMPSLSGGFPDKCHDRTAEKSKSINNENEKPNPKTRPKSTPKLLQNRRRKKK